MVALSSRAVALVAVALVMSSIPVEAKRRAVAPRAPSVVETSPYLDEALSVAAWLTSLERSTPTGALNWPPVEGRAGASIGIDAGAAGIGSFFLRLHQTTRDPKWLDKAERGAQFVLSEFRAGRFNTHEWLGGSAGAADFLLELYALTRNEVYLQGAHLAGESLIRTAIVDGDGVYWKHNAQIENTYTGVAHGAAGAAIFLVKLYNVTKDSRDLDTAERTYRWLTRYKLELPSTTSRAITWKRLTTDTKGYNGWCGGSMGIAFLLDELHRATGKAEYLDLWNATAEGLWIGASRPREAPLEIGWVHAPTIGGRTDNLGTAYCHGTAGNGVTLAEAAVRNGAAYFAEGTDAAGRWLDRVAVADRGGALWEHFIGGGYRETGLFTGTASVGHGSLKMYALTGNAAHLNRARTAARYLLGVAEHPRPGQTRWLNRYDNSSETREYRTGMYSGVAGIGLFLIELHDAERGRQVPVRFSPLHP
ncbi:MAG TPA: lanthionine synthetase LanC family protein [Thermoanaerobaculia bacterium]|nr:lanthionine synthetase LanC family protein [Thermoanaerobaculia bacterium]